MLLLTLIRRRTRDKKKKGNRTLFLTSIATRAVQQRNDQPFLFFLFLFPFHFIYMRTSINVHLLEAAQKKNRKKKKDPKKMGGRRNDNYRICIHSMLQGNLTNVPLDITFNQWPISHITRSFHLLLKKRQRQ